MENRIIQNETVICTGEFVTALIKEAGIVPENRDVVRYGYEQGWLQEQDVAEQRKPLVKKQCARIVHEFLRREQGEPDEIRSGPAGKLQDLFDCRVCAGHVMQVYVKGIMDGYRNVDGRLIFGMEDTIDPISAQTIIRRIFRKELRLQVQTETEESVSAEQISYEQALAILECEKQVLLLDVRTEPEYTKMHLKNAIHCPMMELLKNPYATGERRDVHVLVYCEKGYMSETAAQSLTRAGYENVSYFAWDRANA